MLIAQLTDLHIKESGKLAYRKVDTVASLKNAINHLNTLVPRPDQVIITGDLGDFGTPDEYALICELLADLTLPYSVIPGNHDCRTNMREAFSGKASFDHPEYCHFIQSAGDYQLIGLDTSVAGKPYGFLENESLVWLEQQLSKHVDSPTLLFLHHPPMAVGLSHMDVQNLKNADELKAVLKQHPQVKGIVAGHLHRPISATWADIPVWVGPSHSHSVTLDLDPEAPSSFSMEPPAIRLFTLGEDTIVSHLSYIKDSEGPYPFFDENNQLID
ncbi:phosphodiesterase [Photobacterium makurazakiensis]|uniref:phosphodiesterase n=1 Tax=Photobacterium makurazakiensis TaxID=2910234 RepID=UPI003D12EBC5